jgi:hypothetical protein
MAVLSIADLPGSLGSSSSLLSQVGSSVVSSAESVVGLNPTSGRVNVNGMFRYSSAPSGPSTVVIYPQASNDWRVRVSLAPNSTYFYNDPNNSLLSPLITETGGGTSAVQNYIQQSTINNGQSGSTRVGVVFPYSPQVQIQHTANYSQQKLTHNNYAQYFYDNSEVQAINITGDFSVQNINEGQYLLASIYFFRSCTKMFFGQDINPSAGNPPPIVYLNGYGQYYLPNVPCVVTSFSHTMPSDVDYMDIPEPGLQYNPQNTNYRLNSTRLPTTSSISLTLQPIYSRLAQSQGFSLADFAAGALVNPSGTGLPSSAFGASQTARYATNRPNGGFL